MPVVDRSAKGMIWQSVLLPREKRASHGYHWMIQILKCWWKAQT